MAKKKSVKKAKVKVVSKPEELKVYSATLNCGGLMSESTGDTIVECLENLHPTIIKSRSILTIRKGELTSSISLVPLRLKRLLVNKMYRQILEKRLLNSLR